MNLNSFFEGPTSQILGQAILGSSLYILFRAQEFLSARSFDPRYSSAYFTRWVTGVISGVVLAHLSLPDGKLDSKTFNVSVLALLGGFAAEAVELILKRMVEILVTGVCGDSGKNVQTQMAALQEKKNAEVLAKVAEVRVAPGSPEERALEQVKALLKQDPAGR